MQHTKAITYPTKIGSKMPDKLPPKDNQRIQHVSKDDLSLEKFRRCNFEKLLV